MAAKKHRRKQVRRSKKAKKLRRITTLRRSGGQGGIRRAGTGVIVSDHLPLTTG